jgi:hypothetical protein
VIEHPPTRPSAPPVFSYWAAFLRSSSTPTSSSSRGPRTPRLVQQQCSSTHRYRRCAPMLRDGPASCVAPCGNASLIPSWFG